MTRPRPPEPVHRVRWTDTSGVWSDWMDATDVSIEQGVLAVTYGPLLTWLPLACIGGPIEIETLPGGLA